MSMHTHCHVHAHPRRVPSACAHTYMCRLSADIYTCPSVRVHTRRPRTHQTCPCRHICALSVHTQQVCALSVHTHQMYPCKRVHARAAELSAHTYPCTRPCRHIQVPSVLAQTHTDVPSIHAHAHTHTRTPSVCAHTHILPSSQVPRAALHSGSQEAVARADSPFPQTHGVTLVHMHAVRCYLCNHISTPPQILPYKDIGSRCCMLFMAFHTHMHSTEPRGCFSCTHIRFFPIKKQTHTPQNTSKCWALAPHGCSGGPLGLRAPRFWGGSSQEAQADGQTSFSSMWGHCRRSLYSWLLHAQLPREQGSSLGWGSDCSVPSLVLPSTPPPTTTTHC